MPSDCHQCGEHTLDCQCNLEKCPKCGRIIYRFDQTCIQCLIQESRELIKKTDENLKIYFGMD